MLTGGLITVPLASAQTYDDAAKVFAQSCVGCHSAKGKAGGLNLETYDGLKAGGKHGQEIVAGKSGDSRLALMISGKMQPAMPMGGKLTAEEIASIEKWIDAGAKPPEHPSEAVAAAKPVIPHIALKVPLKPEIFAMEKRPNANVVAVAGYKEVRLLDPASGKAIATLPGEAETVRAIAFSADGKLLAAAGGLPARNGEVKIWDVDGQKLVSTINGHHDCIYGVAFSPDEKQVATASYDKLIKIWDVASGKEVRTLKDHTDAVNVLLWTPDGKRIISGGADRTIKVWNPETGERLYTLGDNADAVNTLALSPDGKQLAAAGGDKSIRIWTLGDKNADLVNTQIAHEDAILKLAWSPDGKMIASSSTDRTIKVFNSSDLSEVKTIVPQSDWVYGLEFSRDGKHLIAGRFDGSLSVYDTQNYSDTLQVRTAAR